MKKILIVGNYNAQNLGDNLLLIALKKNLPKILPGSKLFVMAPKEPYDFPLPPAGLRSWLKLNFIKAKHGLQQADVVVFGGGGLLNPEEPRSVYIWGKVIKCAYKLKKPVLMIGQSIVDTKSRAVAKLIKKVELISVRDQQSVHVLNKYEVQCPVRHTADLAFLLDRQYFKSDVIKFEHDKFVVLNLREYSHVSESHTLDVAKHVVEHILKYTTLGIYLLPFHKDDLAILSHFKKLFADNGRVFVLPYDKRECYAAIEQSVGVVSQRLHPLISGMICEKPLFALSYSSKVGSLCGAVLTTEFIVDMRDNEPVLNEHGLSAFVKACEGELLNYDLSEVEDMKKKAQLNLKLVAAFCEE